jgi:hypothetical protein
MHGILKTISTPLTCEVDNGAGSFLGADRSIRAAAVGRAAGLTEDQVERVWRDIAAKRKATRYLHEPPLLVE